MNEPCLYAVDDDPETRRSIEILALSLRLPCQTFATAEQLLDAYDISWCGCLLIDLRLGNGMTGLELQKRLAAEGCRLPLILISAYVDVRSAVRAMHGGALTVLEKPYQNNELTDAIHLALKINAERREVDAKRDAVRDRIARLTEREQHVMEMLVGGIPRKTMARQLGCSMRTAARLCANVYEKMEMDTAAGLSQLVSVLRDPDETFDWKTAPETSAPSSQPTGD